jgi:hypothetical protein
MINGIQTDHHQAISTSGRCDLTTPNTWSRPPKARHPDAARRAITALRRIADNPAAISFDSVAREAGVARKTFAEARRDVGRDVSAARAARSKRWIADRSIEAG